MVIGATGICYVFEGNRATDKTKGPDEGASPSHLGSLTRDTAPFGIAACVTKQVNAQSGNPDSGGQGHVNGEKPSQNRDLYDGDPSQFYGF